MALKITIILLIICSDRVREANPKNYDDDFVT